MNTIKKMLLVGLVSCGMVAGAHAAAALDDAELAGVAKQIWEHPKFSAAVRDAHSQDMLPGPFLMTHGGEPEDMFNRSVRDFYVRGQIPSGEYQFEGPMYMADYALRYAWGKIQLIIRTLDKLPELELGDRTVDKNLVDQFVAMGRDDAFKHRIAVKLNELR